MVNSDISNTPLLLIYCVMAIYIIMIWSIQPIIAKHIYTSKISPITYILYTSTLNYIFVLVYAIYNTSTIFQDVKLMTYNTYYLMFINSFFCVFVANICYHKIIDKYGLDITMSILFIYPLIGLLMHSYINNSV